MGVALLARWRTLVGLAFALRLLLALTPGYGFDTRTFRAWGQTLATRPWAELYAREPSADHLPGDLVWHGVLARTFAAVDLSPSSSYAYAVALKLVPIAADAVLVALVWVLARRLVGAGDGVAAVQAARGGAVLMAWSPALIYTSARWGQWDSVSAVLLLGGLCCVWLGRRVWAAPAAVVLLTWAVLMKPPLLWAVLLGVGVWLWPLMASISLRRLAVGGVLAVLASAATTLALCLPFRVGVAPGLLSFGQPWTLVGRAGHAAALWPFTTMGADNVWMLLAGQPWDPPRDTGWPFVTGWVLLGIAVVVTLLGVRGWGRGAEPGRMVEDRMVEGRGGSSGLVGALPGSVVPACWAAAVGVYASFLVLTRAHERYVFPALVLLVVLAALCRLDRRVVWLALAASTLTAINVLQMDVLAAQPPSSWFLRSAPYLVVSLGHVVVWVLLVLLPWRRATPGRSG